MDPIIVVGGGLAGYSMARTLRRSARGQAVVLVTDDAGDYYSKPALSNALAGGRSAPQLVLNTAAEMQASTGARILTRCRVSAIDPARHNIATSQGEMRYAKLVLALGATPIAPRLAGDAAAEVACVNNLGDYAAFRTRLEHAGRVAVIGAGLIGCEFANDLAAAGHAVDVVEIAGQPLPRLLSPDAALPMRQGLEAIGVRWHLGRSARSLARLGARYRLALDDGRVLECDLVLSAIGLAPNIDLARSAGLAVNRGIVVDGHLATSAPDVYALGDCAEVEGRVLPFVEPISHAARALGATLGGTPTAVRYPAMPVRVKTPACPTVVMPDAAALVA